MNTTSNSLQEYISLVDPSPLLDLERNYRVYLFLRGARKVRWGYEVVVQFVKRKMLALAKVTRDSVEIIDPSGSFDITFKFTPYRGKTRVEATWRSSFDIASVVESALNNIIRYGPLLKPSPQRSSAGLRLTVNPKGTFDLRGEQCPVVELKAKKIMSNFPAMTSLEFLVDHPAAVIYSLPDLAKSTQSSYVVIENDDYVSFIITAGAEPHCGDFLARVRQSTSPSRLPDYDVCPPVVSEEGGIITSTGFHRDLIPESGEYFLVVSPIGRGWRSVLMVNSGKVTSAKLTLENSAVVYDQDALNFISSSNGEINVVYLRPKEHFK